MGRASKTGKRPKTDLQTAAEVRKEVLTLIHRAGTSHVGSNFSCVDLLGALYGTVARKITPEWSEDRDRIIASKGWCAAAVYVFLKHKGILTEEELETFGKPDGLLGLLEGTTKGVEASTGSMGHGLPIGVGMALRAKRGGKRVFRVYVLMSDGEMMTGTTWESAALAAHHKLNNLTVLIDNNKICATGRTNEILKVEPLERKWESFGWDVKRIDGHNLNEINLALAKRGRRKPLAVIAETVKGKGCSIFENKLEWHYRHVDDVTYKLAMAELSNGKEQSGNFY